MIYYGRSIEENGVKRLQTLQDHLEGTEKLAVFFAASFHAEPFASYIARLHDVGKASAAGQERIVNNGPKVDHATMGAQKAREQGRFLLAYPIAGHHSGLPNYGSSASASEKGTLASRLRKQVGNCKDFLDGWKVEKPPEQIPIVSVHNNVGFSISFFVRMLFSCLVDADCLDAEAFGAPEEVHRGQSDSIEVIAGRMEQKIQTLQAPRNEMNAHRTRILNRCIECAKHNKGLFTLTVPTGGGKTLSSFAFALLHAREHGMQRVIYAIPYTSILEQNAAVFERIVGESNVLRHYADVAWKSESSDEQEEADAWKKRLSSENWNIPVIATTNVQFFESLFGAKTSKCRKLHNMANSVIVLDEVQMLPLNYLLPCLYALAELVTNYGCTVVMMSATQPGLEKLFPEKVREKCCEISMELAESYLTFKRVKIVLDDSVKHKERPLNDEELAKRLMEYPQVLCIVNTRDAATSIFEKMVGGNGDVAAEGCYCLTTLLLAQDRSDMIDEIKARLALGQTCRVVATSLIECGVDVDFPIGYREHAGLDSILQAAGRVNREGKRSFEESILFVYEGQRRLTTDRTPEGDACKIVFDNFEDLVSPDAIAAYFRELYEVKGRANMDQKSIVGRLEAQGKYGKFPFAEIAEDFKLIEDHTYGIFIPSTRAAQECIARIERSSEISMRQLREIGKYLVKVRANQKKALQAAGAVREVAGLEWLVLENMEMYSEVRGLTIPENGGMGLFA